MTIISMLSQAPSVQLFQERLINDLASGQSLLVLLPAGVDPSEVWSILRGKLWHQGFSIEEVSPHNWPPDSSLVIRLSEVLGIDWTATTGPYTLEEFLNATEHICDIVYIEGCDQAPATSLTKWMEFLKRWARTNQSRANIGQKLTRLCLIVSAEALLSLMPDSDVYLAVHWWWGVPSGLETHLLCRLGHQGNGMDNAARWREYILPALTGNNISLIDHLWYDLHLNIDELMIRLRDFGLKRGWSEEALLKWGVRALIGTNNRYQAHPMFVPPAEVRLLWAHGLLNWTPEYGIELHTAALAVLGRIEDIRHRLWRGQVELLLPLINHIRLMFCSHLTRSYGNEWPVRWYQPESVEEEEAVRRSPFACELGYLTWLLDNCVQLRAERRWRSVLVLAHRIRNDIAHYRPITFYDFDGLSRKFLEITSTSSLEYNG